MERPMAASSSDGTTQPSLGNGSATQSAVGGGKAKSGSGWHEFYCF